MTHKARGDRALLMLAIAFAIILSVSVVCGAIIAISDCARTYNEAAIEMTATRLAAPFVTPAP